MRSSSSLRYSCERSTCSHHTITRRGNILARNREQQRRNILEKQQASLLASLVHCVCLEQTEPVRESAYKHSHDNYSRKRKMQLSIEPGRCCYIPLARAQSSRSQTMRFNSTFAFSTH